MALRPKNTRAAYTFRTLKSSNPALDNTFASFLKLMLLACFRQFQGLTEQAVFCALSYTAKLAGRERIRRRPEATFSTCFGEPFLPLAPTVCADALKN